MNKWKKTVRNALAIIKRGLTLVPDKIKQALSRRPGPFGDGIVYSESTMRRLMEPRATGASKGIHYSNYGRTNPASTQK